MSADLRRDQCHELLPADTDIFFSRPTDDARRHVIASTAQIAAQVIAAAWREHSINIRVAKIQAMHAASRTRAAENEEERRRARATADEPYTLPGVLARVWPIVRETVVVMFVAVTLVLAAPPAFDALPGSFDVRGDDSPEQQLVAALWGASVAVVAFFFVFMGLVLLYVYRWERTLHAAHALYISALLGAPLCLLLLRLCEHTLRIPLDGLSLAFLTVNLTAPAIVLIQWPPTAERFAAGRRLYAAALALATAWLLAYVPYQTAVTALLLLAVLDVVLVSLPGAPVQRLDEAHSWRVRTGEPQMPGLTFKHSGLELGLGDFIVYSAFAAHAAKSGVAPLFAVVIGIIVGLTLTMTHVALARRRRVVPALPLSVALGALMLAIERFVLHPLFSLLAAKGMVL